jgi:hypothetical protein
VLQLSFSLRIFFQQSLQYFPTFYFYSTFTTSFGSICFGSLLVAILSALRQLANAARADDEGGILLCIAECILGCLESLLEYFNTWVSTYQTIGDLIEQCFNLFLLNAQSCVTWISILVF